MTLHIGSATSGPVVLGPNSKRLTTITSTGTVTATGVGVDGIDGPSTNRWPIANDGTVISSGGLGISLAAGGSVSNGRDALISGGIAGVLINGADGTIGNAGTITGTAAGGGTLINTTLVSGDGIALLAGGSVTNAASGSIAAYGAIHVSHGSGSGVFITGGPGSVTNRGHISATAYGVALDAGGVVTNPGSIGGVEDGVIIYNNIGTVTNSGSIVATGDDGVALFAGGAVTNAAGALIQSGSLTATPAGVFITGGSGTLENSGTIIGTNIGALLASGSVTNHMGGSIAGSTAGVSFNAGPGTLANVGRISASAGVGADLEGGGSVTNAAGASISGGKFGVFITGGSGTVENAGTLSGGTYAVAFSGTGDHRLIVDSGAVFVGGVTGSGASNTLELTGGANAISGVGTGSFNGFQTLAVDAGSTATLNGPNVVPTVLDNGTLDIAGSLDVSTAIDPASTGIFQLNGGATLDIAAAIGNNATINFLPPAPTGDELAIDNFASFGTLVGNPPHYTGPLLENFTAGDMIDLKNFAFNQNPTNEPPPSFDAATGVLQISNGTSTAFLSFQTSSAASFDAKSDGGTGTLITLHA